MQFPWQIWHHTQLWKSPSATDGIHYSSPQHFVIFSYSYYTSLLTPLELESENNQISNPFANTLAMPILNAKYEQDIIHDVAFNPHHLMLDQQCNLFNILSKHKKLFDGSLGVYPHKKVHIYLKPGAKPVHHCTYPVPHVHWQTFKKELNHMVELGILAPWGASEWASPAFIIPKKDGHIQQITDLCWLNEAIIQKQYSLPIITDLLDCISGYKFFTNLAFPCNTTHSNSMSQVKSFVSSQCILANTNLPMGLKCATDIAQQVMEEVLHNVKDIGVYLNDIGAFSFTWELHILLLEKYYIGWKPMASLSIRSNENGPFRKLICLAIGSHPLVCGLGVKIDGIINAKTYKPISNAWLPWWCQSLPLHVASMCTHLSSSLQPVWEENILLDS